jgi:hypothetical protein
MCCNYYVTSELSGLSEAGFIKVCFGLGVITYCNITVCSELKGNFDPVIHNKGNACYHSVLSSHLTSRKLKIKIYRTVILAVVLYGCEAWSLTLREEHRLRVFENRVLRIFGPKREEDGCHGENYIMMQLHSLYSSPNNVRVIKSRRTRWAGHGARIGEGRGVYRVLVGRPEGKRSLGRPRSRWEDNIKMDEAN